MAHVIVTLKVMPESVEVNMDSLLEDVKEAVEDFEGEFSKADIEEVAYGLKALKVFFVINENKSNLDPLEESVSKIKGVGSVTVDDVRRLLG